MSNCSSKFFEKSVLFHWNTFVCLLKIAFWTQCYPTDLCVYPFPNFSFNYYRFRKSLKIISGSLLLFSNNFNSSSPFMFPDKF
jgi:hypothetical protein